MNEKFRFLLLLPLIRRLTCVDIEAKIVTTYSHINCLILIVRHRCTSGSHTTSWCTLTYTQITIARTRWPIAVLKEKKNRWVNLLRSITNFFLLQEMVKAKIMQFIVNSNHGPLSTITMIKFADLRELTSLALTVELFRTYDEFLLCKPFRRCLV